MFLAKRFRKVEGSVVTVRQKHLSSVGDRSSHLLYKLQLPLPFVSFRGFHVASFDFKLSISLPKHRYCSQYEEAVGLSCLSRELCGIPVVATNGKSLDTVAVRAYNAQHPPLVSPTQWSDIDFRVSKGSFQHGIGYGSSVMALGSLSRPSSARPRVSASAFRWVYNGVDFVSRFCKATGTADPSTAPPPLRLVAILRHCHFRFQANSTTTIS